MSVRGTVGWVLAQLHPVAGHARLRPSHAHTSTHALSCARTLTRASAHTHAPTCKYAYSHTHTYTHTRARARTHARKHARMHAHAPTHTHTHARTHARTQTYTHIRVGRVVGVVFEGRAGTAEGPENDEEGEVEVLQPLRVRPEPLHTYIHACIHTYIFTYINSNERRGGGEGMVEKEREGERGMEREK